MLPAVGGVGAAGAWLQQQQPAMGMRAVVRAHLLLGFATATFALYAVTLDPPYFQTQIEDATQTWDGQCTATAAQTMELRTGALLLVLTGAAQAVAAAAADMAAGTTAGTVLGRFLAFVAQMIGVMNAYLLYYAVRGVAVVAVGRCSLGYDYRATLVIVHVPVAVSFCMLIIVGLVAVPAECELRGVLRPHLRRVLLAPHASTFCAN